LILQVRSIDLWLNPCHAGLLVRKLKADTFCILQASLFPAGHISDSQIPTHKQRIELEGAAIIVAGVGIQAIDHNDVFMRNIQHRPMLRFYVTGESGMLFEEHTGSIATDYKSSPHIGCGC
jgi:hypothetical protein